MAIGVRKLGSQGLEVSTLGLGCMGLSAFYGSPLEDKDGVALVHHAFNKGVTFFDTSNAYGPYTNEKLLGLAFKTLPRDKIQIATKFGICFQDGDITKVQIRGDPKHVKESCHDSLERLGVDYIDLYYQHRVDPTVPIEVTVGALKELVEEGKVKYIGLSEASADTIRRAHAVHPISAVQIEWSLWTRDIEEEIIPLCRELGIGIVPYSPLGRGFFSGSSTVDKLSETDVRRKMHPRFQAENAEKNKVLFERVAALAEKHKCTPGQLALAWVLHQGDDVVPIPGTTKIPNLDTNVGAVFVKLTPEELKEVAAAVPHDEVAGSRYTAGMIQYSWSQVTTPPLSSYVAPHTQG